MNCLWQDTNIDFSIYDLPTLSADFWFKNMNNMERGIFNITI